MDTRQITDEILAGIRFTAKAHIDHPKTPADAVRFWDMATPYLIHPCWCAMTLLTETSLPDEIRLPGYLALLFHDVIEDADLELPATTAPVVVELVQDMTFDSFSNEVDDIWSRSETVRLLKLYDKTSNLLDASWMSIEKWNKYARFTNQLARDVESNFGDLNIVKIADAIALQRS